MRERGFIIWFVVVVVLVAALNLPGPVSRVAKSGLRELVAPLQGAVSGLIRKSGGVVHSVRGFGDLAEQNEIMSEELVRLRNELLTYGALDQENRHLRKQLAYRERSAYDLISCEVIARDVGGWWQTLRLSKGYLDGIDSDMAAITPDGLVGKSIDVSPRTTDLILISDPNCRVSVFLPRTGAFGIMAGRGQAPTGRTLCRVEFINKDLHVQPGDDVVTSGLGGVFPRGLGVGKIETVSQDASGLYQTADVRVQSNIGRLAHVFMVVGQKDPVEDLLMKKARMAKERE